MKTRCSWAWFVLFLMAIAAVAQPYNEAQFKGMQWRGIGPYRGGRVLAVTNHRKTSPLAFRKIAHEAARAAGREISQLKDLPSALDCPPGPTGPFPAKSMLITVK